MSIRDFVKDFILPHENVYDKQRNVISENDPADPGGLTKYGIDKRSHPEIDIEALTEEKAISIYLAEYANSLAMKLTCPASYVYFDCRVNAGEKRAIKCLQEALGLEADGIVGHKTLGAIYKINGSPEFWKDMIGARRNFYHRLSQTGSFKKFLAGWLNRCRDLEEFAAKTLKA